MFSIDVNQNAILDGVFLTTLFALHDLVRGTFVVYFPFLPIEVLFLIQVSIRLLVLQAKVRFLWLPIEYHLSAFQPTLARGLVFLRVLPWRFLFSMATNPFEAFFCDVYG